MEDRYGVLANIASVFGNNCVSLAQVIQRRKRGELAELVVITDSVERERNFEDALSVLRGMSSVKEVSTIIRVV